MSPAIVITYHIPLRCRWAVFQPGEQILCEIMDVQYAPFAPIRIVAKSAYPHVSEASLSREPFLWPE